MTLAPTLFEEPTGKKQVLAQQLWLGHMQSNEVDNERNNNECIMLLCH